MIKQFKQTALATVLVTGGLVLSACGSSEIALDDYLELEYTGVNGYGEVIPTLDTEAVAAEYADDIDEDSKPSGITNEEFLASTLDSHVSLSADKARELSNGDDVVITWAIKNQETVEELMGVTFAYEDVAVEVDTLATAEAFDAFEEIDMMFSGLAPSGKADINAGDSSFLRGDLTVEPTSGLSNGDTVTVTISDAAIDLLAGHEGRVPAETEKEYVVEGLSKHTMTLSEIDDAAFEKMDKQGQDYLTAYVAGAWDDPSRYDGATLLGHYMLTPKDRGSTSEKNRVILAYEITTTDNFTFNSYIEFHDLLNLADGTTTFDEGRYTTPSGFDGRFRTDDGLTYLGYESLDQLFNHKVAQYVDRFDYETTLER